MPEIHGLFSRLEDLDDVGQSRYLMNRIFDLLLEERYEESDRELPEPGDRIDSLQEFDGYLFKLSQDFLTESSTMKKREKLEDIRDHVL